MTDYPLPPLTQHLAGEPDTLALGQALAHAVQPPLVVYLSGDLGAGKTTLSRGLLRGLGHAGSVKSPTYTLVEPYSVDAMPVYHFDLYRLGDAEELEYLGLRDYLGQRALLLFEWPERGGAYLPPPDVSIELEALEAGREARLRAHSDAGAAVLAHLSL